MAAWLHDSLVDRLGAGRVFLDIDSIKPGVDFIGAITKAIDQCTVILVIIGSQWLAEDNDGRRRIDEPDDVVRIEIEAALNRDIQVIPVLLESTPMPRATDLPGQLVELTRNNALRVSRDNARADIERLLAAVADLLGSRLLSRTPLRLGCEPLDRMAYWLTDKLAPKFPTSKLSVTNVVDYSVNCTKCTQNTSSSPWEKMAQSGFKCPSNSRQPRPFGR